jgi:hypothetical protein
VKQLLLQFRGAAKGFQILKWMLLQSGVYSRTAGRTLGSAIGKRGDGSAATFTRERRSFNE